MKIAIMSDSHDNIPRIDQMLGILTKENIKIIIHCGDVCAPGVMKYLAQKFEGDIYLSLGNVDGDHEMMKKMTSKDTKNIKLFEEFGEIEIDNIKIAFTHFPESAKELAKTDKYNFVFYGHTHKPWEEKINNCKVLNPGTLAGLFNKSTFAILDTKTKITKLIVL
ncbi:MAG: YfcE family phosphodiesterase [Patescibacteria group bacterium]|nr:YfcE family phosphodiesterase [Patescibacteria group bacterium]MDD4304172.1 YfcE family phosphodiesterase [Patescibacteria group bacterium]MDD4695204.1 YfcE family phosphodiesterase [Patescibacteria group bacterium]